MRQTPPAALKRSSFMLSCFEPIERIGSRALELWSECFQQICVRKEFVLDFLLELVKFGLEFGVEIYLPRHDYSML